MMRKPACAVAAAVLSFSGAAAAVTPDDYEIPYVGGAFAYEFEDSGRDSDNGLGYQVWFGVPMKQFEGKSLEFTFHNVERERHLDGQDDYQSSLMVDLVHDFGLFGWGREAEVDWLPQFKPFLLGGLGAVQDDVQGTDHVHFGANLGAGLLMPLPWAGLGLRTEWRVLAQANDESVAGEDILIDYRVNVGLQVPLTPVFDRGTPRVAPPEECELAVVDPETGRSDCETDSDRDGVTDTLDQCPGTPEGTPVDAQGCPAGGGSDGDGDGVPDMVDACPGTKSGIVVDMNGCAVDQTMTLRSVYFRTDTAELTSEARAILEQVATTLKGQENLQVEIGGHADADGSQAYNLMLSQQRAESVRQYLIARGIAPSRLVTQGYGEFRPSDGDPAANRRVDFKLIVQ